MEQNETSRVCILFTGGQCRQGPSEEVAELGGGRFSLEPTGGWQGEETGLVQEDCVISKYAEGHGNRPSHWW